MAYENDSYTREGTDTRAGSGDTTVLNTLIGTLIDSVEGYQKAAAGDGQREAIRRLALIYERKAKELFQRAAAAGDKEAKRKLLKYE